MNCSNFLRKAGKKIHAAADASRAWPYKSRLSLVNVAEKEMYRYVDIWGFCWKHLFELLRKIAL